MEPWADAPSGTAIGLKLMGSVHRLVLTGELPELAAFYPSAGGAQPVEGSELPFFAALGDKAQEISQLLHLPVQTNEVGRSAALLGGFLEVAHLPLRVLEVGSSAGLNLRWDHYRYEHDGIAWGPTDSPVTFAPYESAPNLGLEAQVVARIGCDPAPIDASTDAGRLTLSSYVWADQAKRWQLLQSALEVATRVPARIERVGAGDWLERVLAEPAPGTSTVVFHSIVTQYMTPAERERVVAVITEAGELATPNAPLAWLRMEPPEERGDDLAHVHLTRWPGGETRLVARAGYHGRPVIWLA